MGGSACKLLTHLEDDVLFLGGVGAQNHLAVWQHKVYRVQQLIFHSFAQQHLVVNQLFCVHQICSLYAGGRAGGRTVP